METGKIATLLCYLVPFSVISRNKLRYPKNIINFPTIKTVCSQISLLFFHTLKVSISCNLYCKMTDIASKRRQNFAHICYNTVRLHGYLYISHSSTNIRAPRCSEEPKSKRKNTTLPLRIIFPLAAADPQPPAAGMATPSSKFNVYDSGLTENLKVLGIGVNSMELPENVTAWFLEEILNTSSLYLSETMYIYAAIDGRFTFRRKQEKEQRET